MVPDAMIRVVSIFCLRDEDDDCNGEGGLFSEGGWADAAGIGGVGDGDGGGGGGDGGGGCDGGDGG